MCPASFSSAATARLSSIEPVKKHGFVLRKKMKIIIEHNEIVFRDSGVRRVGVFEVNRTIRQTQRSQGRGRSRARSASVNHSVR